MYILYSVATITNSVHLGYMLAYLIENLRCTTTLLTQPLVIACLSGFALLLLIFCVVIVMCLIFKIHPILEQHSDKK